MRNRLWSNQLKSKGCRVTEPREMILKILSGTSDHLSAEDVFLRIKKELPGCGLTTVYRTLDLLSEVGIVTYVDFGDGRARIELSPQHGGTKHHHHLICNRCLTVLNYSDFMSDEIEFLKKLEAQLSQKYGFTIEEHDIGFRGRCRRCAQKKGRT